MHGLPKSLLTCRRPGHVRYGGGIPTNPSVHDRSEANPVDRLTDPT